MQDLPHHYKVNASSEIDGNVALKADDLPQIITAPPAEFGGPGDQWSPETLLVGAIADCFVLTFRAIAKASKLDWNNLECSAEGVLDRVDKVTRFTTVKVTARLTVPAGTDADKAQRLMEKSEAVCLVTRSLLAEAHLDAEVIVSD
jgi:peroxiredoxin-like protein